MRSRLRAFLALFALGLLGVLALGGTLVVQLRDATLGVPVPLAVALSLVTPTLLLVVGAAVGTLTAPRVGLRSHVYDRVTANRPIWPALRGELDTAVVLGVGLFVVAAALDAAFAPFVTLPGAQTAPAALLGSLPYRLLYGGVTEEVMFRWGFVSLLAWMGWLALGRPETGAPPAVVGVAVVVSSVLFGVGHLPALAATAPLSPALVVRTVLLNAVAGVGFGWLYWRESLEAAMVAHASFHVALVGVSLVLTVAFG